MMAPDLQNYSDYQTYLSDLYKMNRKKSGVGSYRYYAQKLNWPVSYLNEVISKKKKLTLNRALELGLFLKLDGVDIEKLIFLTLKESEHKQIQHYFSAKISKEGQIEGHFDISQKKSTGDKNIMLVPEEIFSDISLLAISDVIVMHRGEITLAEISESLFSFPELKELKTLIGKIEFLESKNIIKRKFKNRQVIGFDYAPERLTFSVDKKTAKHMIQFADNYRKIMSGDHAKGWITSGFIKLSKDRLLEAKKRILALRNWLLELETDVLADLNYDPKNVLIFQMDVNLLSILNCQRLGISSLDDWMTDEPVTK